MRSQCYSLKRFSMTILMGVAFLSGCALSKEGAVDYRRAEVFGRSIDTPLRTEHAIGASEITTWGTEPYAPALLLRKDMGVVDEAARIAKGDKISIRLRDGFLKTCIAFLGNPLRGFKKNCEIAIVFKAFELGEGQDFDFKPGAEKDGRLVYFSHDVEPGQFFNLHNMPVYGPIEYTGKPLAIDIYILEIDAGDKQAFALLRTLAKAGATAYAPAAPVVGVLDRLGSALLNSGTDDVEYRYSMVLDPSGGYGGTVYATAEAGDYVLIREDTRNARTNWDDLVLDHNTGKVWRKKPQDVQNDDPQCTAKYCMYRDNTYLTVQVLRNAGNVDVPLAQNTYGDFREALDRDATEKAKDIQNLLEPLTALAYKRVRIKTFHRAQGLYESMIASAQNNNTSKARQEAFDVFNLLRTSVENLNAADEEARQNSPLDSTQVEHLLKKLRALTDEDTDLTVFDPTPKGFGTLTFETFYELIKDGLFPES